VGRRLYVHVDPFTAVPGEGDRGVGAFRAAAVVPAASGEPSTTGPAGKVEAALAGALTQGRADFFVRFADRADLTAASRVTGWAASTTSWSCPGPSPCDAAAQLTPLVVGRLLSGRLM